MSGFVVQGADLEQGRGELAAEVRVVGPLRGQSREQGAGLLGGLQGVAAGADLAGDLRQGHVGAGQVEPGGRLEFLIDREDRGELLIEVQRRPEQRAAEVAELGALQQDVLADAVVVAGDGVAGQAEPGLGLLAGPRFASIGQSEPPVRIGLECQDAAQGEQGDDERGRGAGHQAAVRAAPSGGPAPPTARGVPRRARRPAIARCPAPAGGGSAYRSSGARAIALRQTASRGPGCRPRRRGGAGIHRAPPSRARSRHPFPGTAAGRSAGCRGSPPGCRRRWRAPAGPGHPRPARGS